MAVRRQPAGTLNNSGEQGCLWQGDISQILVEISPRSLRKAADGERSSLSQVYPVPIKLENLLLGELLFQFLGDQHLRELAPDRLFRRQKEAARKLHSNGRPALAVPLPGQIDPTGLHHADKIHAAMLKEAPVFNGQHR